MAPSRQAERQSKEAQRYLDAKQSTKPLPPLQEAAEAGGADAKQALSRLPSRYGHFQVRTFSWGLTKQHRSACT
jgi:hypothetical protein